MGDRVGARSRDPVQEIGHHPTGPVAPGRVGRADALDQAAVTLVEQGDLVPGDAAATAPVLVLDGTAQWSLDRPECDGGGA